MSGSDPQLLMDMAASAAEEATLAPGDVEGRRRLLARFRLDHGGRRLPDPPFGQRVDGGPLPVPPEGA